MSDLVKNVSITNLASQRAAVVERMRQALDLLGKAQKLANGTHIGFPHLVTDNSYSRRDTACATGDYAERDEAKTCILHTIDTEGWNCLLQESGLRTLMDTTARDMWARQIIGSEMPELITTNIKTTFGQLYEARGDMFEHGVLQCLRRLSWDYKTNRPFKSGKRVIVTGLITGGYAGSRATDELNNLVRIFHMLDDRPEASHRNGMHVLISDTRHERRRETENAYLHLRWSKSGSGHTTSKRPDLVNKLNLILAKHCPTALATERRR